MGRAKVDTRTGEVRIIRSGSRYPVVHMWHVVVTSKRQYLLKWADGSDTVTLETLLAPGSGSAMYGPPSAWVKREAFRVFSDVRRMPPLERVNAIESFVIEFIGDQLIPDVPRLSCGHHPSPSGAGTGYATFGEGGDAHRVCYPCATVRHREAMREATVFRGAYVAHGGKIITDWTEQGKLGDVVHSHETHDGTRLFVRMRDVHGAMWYGTGAGESMLITLRKYRNQPES